MKKKTKIIFAVAGAAILLLVILKASGVIGNNFAGKEVTTEKAAKRTIVQKVSASGKIMPQIEVKIAPEVSGEIIMLQVKEGDKVQKGQLLVQIKPDIYESNLRRAEAALEQSKSALKQSEAQMLESKREYGRSQKLYESNVISQSEWESVQTSYSVAQLQYEAAQATYNSSNASLTEAQDNLRRTRIYAPIDGTISKLNVEQGERVVGTAQMAGTEVLRVADLDVMEVEVTVNENDIVKLAVGNPVDVQVDAYWGKTFKGEVTEIGASAANEATSGTEVTNFTVKILLLEDSYRELKEEKNLPNTPFKPGMTASVDIETERQQDVLSLPIKAVTSREVKDKDKGKNGTRLDVVFVDSAGFARQKEIKIGIQDDEFIQILSGIGENDDVITGPYNLVSKELKDSAMVKTSSGKKGPETPAKKKP